MKATRQNDTIIITMSMNEVNGLVEDYNQLLEFSPIDDEDDEEARKSLSPVLNEIVNKTWDLSKK